MSSEPLPPWDTTETFKWTGPPAPGFVFGQKVDATPEGKAWVEAGEAAGFQSIETAKHDPFKLYQLMTSAIIPRPIAFVSSLTETGVENLAPFSWFNMVIHNPPLVSITCAVQQGKQKDTAVNIKTTKQFTVNMISEPFVQNANASAVDAPADVSEWAITGLTKEPSTLIKPSRVKESAFSMECELYQAIDITHPDTGAITGTLILGLVKELHVRNDVLDQKGNVDPTKFKPVGRLGDITFARQGDGFRIPRPTWDAVKPFVESK